MFCSTTMCYVHMTKNVFMYYRDLRENYCRNPDGRPFPWCFTTDPNVPIAYCTNIPRCGVTEPESEGE